MVLGAIWQDFLASWYLKSWVVPLLSLLESVVLYAELLPVLMAKRKWPIARLCFEGEKWKASVLC